jgi:hypothetical protein
MLALAGPARAETALTKSTVVQYEPYNRFGTCFSALTLLNELPQVVSISLDSLFLDHDGAVIGDPSFRFRNVGPGRVVAEDQPFRNLPCNRIAQIRYRVARCEVDGQRAEIAFCEAQLSFENRAVIEVTLDGLEAAQTP